MSRFFFAATILIMSCWACGRSHSLDVAPSFSAGGSSFGSAAGSHDNTSAVGGSDNAQSQNTAASGTPIPTGFTTSGNQLLSPQGFPLTLFGLNWAGFEGADLTLAGLLHVDSQLLMEQIKSHGYNLLRIPVTLDILTAAGPVTKVDATHNPSLTGSTPLELLDKIVAMAGLRNIRIVLAVYGCDGASANGLWYDDSCSEATWLTRLTQLAKHFSGVDNLLGIEPGAKLAAPAVWGGMDAKVDFRRAVQAAGKAILAVNPAVLIIADCIPDEATSQCGFPHEADGLITEPLLLHKVVYGVTAPLNLATASPQKIWDDGFGFIQTQNIAPVMPCAFSFAGTDPTSAQGAHAQALMDYLGSKRMPFAYWQLMYDPADSSGLLMSDYLTFDLDRQRLLDQIIR